MNKKEKADTKRNPNLLNGEKPVSLHHAMSSRAPVSCTPYHRHLRNDTTNLKNVTTSSNIYHKEIRCCKLSSRKKYRPRHCAHNIKRPYLDFEKMQKVGY